MRKKLLIVAGLSIILFVFSFALSAQQQTQGLRVTPVSLDLALPNGSSNTYTLHLDNFTNKTLEIKVTAQNFTAQGEQGGINLTPQDSTFALSQWIKISPTTAIVRAGERQDFKVTVNVPTNAEPGGHFGSVLFSTVPNASLNATGAVVTQSVGALFLVRIPGDVKESAILESFTVGKSFYEFGPVDFNIRVKNDSSVHIKPIGVITIKNTLTGAKNFIGVDGKNILPGAIRQIPVTWNQKFLFGKYVAYANLNYGSKSYPLSAATEFIGFPLRYALIIVVILIFLFIIRRRLWRAFKIILKG